ncbi:MAG: permease prefix domain 2-containing transporter, partial [Bacteroidota bacterium]
MKRENPSDRSHPPQWLLRFFRWFCHPDCLEDIEGDLLERYESRAKELSRQKAYRKFAWEVFSLFRPGIIRPSIFHSPFTQTTFMFKHHILISYRSALRNKSTFLINLIGLSTGLAT